MPDNQPASGQAKQDGGASNDELPQQTVALADLPLALPDSLAPLLLVDAEFFQYGQLLLIKLADGRIMIVMGYFASAPNLGLPPDLAVAQADVEIITIDAPDFIDYLGMLEATHPALQEAIQQQIADAGPWTGTVTVASVEAGQPADAPADNDGAEPLPEEAELANLDSADLAALELEATEPETAPAVLDTLLDGGGIAEGGDTTIATAGPDAGALAGLSSLNLGGLGGGGSALGALGGTAGSTIGTAPVDGLNGLGGTDSIGGSLGGANPNAFTPPGDAFAGGAVSPVGSRPIIRFEGIYNTSVEELNYKFAGAGQVDFYSTENGADGIPREDRIDFSDAAFWQQSYFPIGYSTSSNKAGLGSFSAASSVITEANLLTNNSFSITITGVNGGAAVVVDISSASSGDQVASLVSANATLAAAGIRVYWNTDENADIGINSFVVSDPSNRTITAASLDATGALTVNNSIGISNIQDIDYSVSGYVAKYPGESGYYTPDARHGLDTPEVQQTNVTRYSVVSADFIDDHVAVGGANNPDFLSLNTGLYDYDTLSFYYDDPAQPGDDLPVTPQSDDPRYTGDGDFDLVSANAYTKVNEINHLEARGYGTNFINLNQAAVQGITEEMIEVTDVGGGMYNVNLNTNVWILDISGDAADVAAFSDASSWRYNGIIDETSYLKQTLDGTGMGVGATGDSTLVPSTRDQFGNIQYQFTATNGGETYYVNISADILDHPDWHWAGGTSGNNAYELPDTQFGDVDFGAGEDTLELNSGLVSKTQSFIGEGGDLANVEIINFTNTQSNSATATIDSATVDLAFVTGATDSDNVLSIIGDSVDSVAIDDVATNWTFLGTVDGSDDLTGYTFKQYAYRPGLTGEATLNVESELATAIPLYYRGWEGDDTFTVSDLSFVALNGGDGVSDDTDWLEVTTDNYDFTATGVADKISNLEVIDARGHTGASTVTLSVAAVATMSDGDNKIHVLGDANDTVVLSDITTNWSWIAHVDGIDDFVGKQFYQYQSLDGTTVVNIWDQILNQPEVRALGDIGGTSSDILVLEDLGFALVDGKTGTDTLQVEQAGVLDYTALGSKVDNIEALDLGGVATAATLDADFVLAATDANDKLVVQGDDTDSIMLADAGSWNYLGVVDAAGPWSALHVYQGSASGGETVFLYQETNLGSVLVDATGTSGDDLFQFVNKDDANLDAGVGTDTLGFLPSGVTRTVDFSTGTTVSGIEILDLRNSSSEDVTFDLGTVDRADNDAVFVLGDAGLDAIDVTDNTQWTLAGRAQFSDAPDMYAYVSGGGQALYVQSDLAQDLFRLAGATSGDDVFRVIDTNFGALNGGGGAFDRLNFLQEGSIDLASLGGSSLTGVEVVDTTNGVVNNLSLSAASIEGTATNDQFYVLGEAGDTLSLNAADNWTFQDTVAVSPDLTLNSYTSVATGGLTVYVDSQVATTIA
ncbi:MAG: hypothetical protein PVH46_07920 [Granulosicoccaceae bacterium]|jgi:hypothetical protein